MTEKKNTVETLKHSTAHVLAAAVLEMFPEAKFGIGPAIENGFYYDFDLPRTLIPEDLPLLEEKMRSIIKAGHKFEEAKISASAAKNDFEKLGQTYKLELIDDLEKENEQICVYKAGPFVDLCAGPHIASTKDINLEAFKLTKISGAYWKADEKNKQLQRIYGVVFETKKELEEYLHMMEEAEKRDHKKLGRELGLFVFSELVGPGLPLYTPKGAIVRREIQDYSNELRKKAGYQEVHTPQINKASLFKKSGHYEKYKDDMFRVVSNYTDEEYYLKPMNCPQHTQIFSSEMRSYKDMPVRIADFANLYRDEKPGQLSGLVRLRAFSQDDGHCFCREDQIKDEFTSILRLIEEAMKTYGMEYYIRLSLRDEKEKEKYIGSDEAWKKSQQILEEILKDKKMNYVQAKGEAAFYGPKMDLVAKDSIGREWQLSTIQLDFNMPERFELEYIGVDGKKHTPVMIHSAIVGSPERFMGILIEHHAGAFPVWLSPVQALVIPVSEEKFGKYAQEVLKKLVASGIRAEIDATNESLGKRIRNGEKQKIPYMLVVGEKEMQVESVAVRSRKGDEGMIKLEDFIERLKKEIADKK
ncbi:MAG TPA: threonine--tRNA ligase [Patescibacteria group bacterium]